MAWTVCAPQGGDDASKQNRAEKKSRKAMLKLGMKPIPGVMRVTVKKSKVSVMCDASACVLLRQLLQKQALHRNMTSTACRCA